MRTGLIGVSLGLLAAVALSAAEVRLRSAAGCTAAVVRVADVAEVFAEDHRVVSALSEITLCPAPASGGKRTLSQAEGQQLLALSGVDRKAANITGSERVTITADGVLRSTAGGKRPMVAGGVRQARFEAEAE